MILDKIQSASLYINLHKGITKALEYFENTNFSTLENGKHIIDGDDVFAIVKEYKTKKIDENILEAHLKYIDVHYIIEGEEQIGIAMFNNQKPTELYDEDNDFMLFNEPSDYITLHKGMFAVFFPDDIHLPEITLGSISKVKKIVLKVKM